MALDISIVTCTMNSSLYLDEMLDSIRSQTEFPKEHIFVDGNSEDGTIEILHRYSKGVPYPVSIITESPKGISNAMNVGSQKSISKFLMHLHSDDKLYSPNSLKDSMELLAVDDSQWLFGRCEYIDATGRHLEFSPQSPYSRKRLLVSNFISHPSVLISRDLFLEMGGFDESLKLAMDYDLWLKVSENEDPIQTDLILSSFRIHAQGASSASRTATTREDYQVRRRYLNGTHEILIAYIRYLSIRFLIRTPLIHAAFMKAKKYKNS